MLRVSTAKAYGAAKSVGLTARPDATVIGRVVKRTKAQAYTAPSAA